MNFQDAIRKIEERGDFNQYAELKPIFESRLSELKADDYTEIGICYYYILVAYLKAHLSHETEEAVEFYEKMDEAFWKQYKLYISENGRANKSELNDFFRLMEKCYSSLESIYIKKNFGTREFAAYRQKMDYRKYSYKLSKRYFKWIEYQILDFSCRYGTSIIRWALTTLSFAVLMSIIYFLSDLTVIEDFKIVDESGHWFDYFYFSVATLTTVGYGDFLPHAPLVKFLAVFEACSGYTMLGIFIGLVQKRIL